MRDKLLVIMIVLPLVVMSLVTGYTIRECPRPTTTEQADLVINLEPGDEIGSLIEYDALPRGHKYITREDDAYLLSLARKMGDTHNSEFGYEASKRIKIKGS